MELAGAERHRRKAREGERAGRERIKRPTIVVANLQGVCLSDALGEIRNHRKGQDRQCVGQFYLPILQRATGEEIMDVLKRKRFG